MSPGGRINTSLRAGLKEKDLKKMIFVTVRAPSLTGMNRHVERHRFISSVRPFARRSKLAV